MNKRRHSLQRGFIHFSLAIFLAGLMTIGSFFSTQIAKLIDRELPKTTPVITVQPANQQTPIGYASPVTTAVTSPAMQPTTPVVTTASAAVQTPSVTLPSLAIPAGTKDCGTDINCFITTANTCASAAVNYAASENLFGYISVSAIEDLQITPTSDGQCSFVNKTLNETFSTDAADLQVAQSEGLSASDVNTQIATLSTAAHKQTIGAMTTCFLPAKNLVTILTKWTHGNINGDDFNNYQCTTVNPPAITVKKK